MIFPRTIKSLLALSHTTAVFAADLTPGIYDETDSNITFVKRTAIDSFSKKDGEEVFGSLYKNTRSYSNNPEAEFYFTLKNCRTVKINGQISTDHGKALITISDLSDQTKLLNDKPVYFNKTATDVRYNDYQVFSFAKLNPNKRYEIKLHSFDGYAVFDKVSLFSPEDTEKENENYAYCSNGIDQGLEKIYIPFGSGTFSFWFKPEKTEKEYPQCR